MITKIILGIITILYLAVNMYTAVSYDPKEMYGRYVYRQCNVGKISAAVFYAPAWFLKAFKRGVNRIIK
jgi:hypothetical protein